VKLDEQANASGGPRISTRDGKLYSQDLRERVIAAVDTRTGAYVAALLGHASAESLVRVVMALCLPGDPESQRDVRL